MQPIPKRLAVIHTGGTIASRPSPDGRGLTPQQAPSVPGLRNVEIHDVQPFNLPSPHITPAHMLELAGLITQLAPDHDGIVVTHGTDTLEETAFALHLLLSTRTPVVLTGSMRHADEVSWDGPANLLDAAGVALSPQTAGRGPLVVFGGDIFDARTVTKVHTTAVDAFGGYPGPIGRIDRAGETAHVRFFATPEQRRTYTPGSLNARVDILYAYAGWRGEGYAQAQADADGIVIAALGTGNLPAELLPLIAATGQPVIIATRTHAGPVLPVYGYAGGGATLVKAGAIPASFLNAHKARLLLLTLLGSGLGGKEIRVAFEDAGF
ncbi:asparaginase [Deinococcus arenicola]|uniref:Asparaginase n=1 Tax=Deinococcus arenicola TaxID=2994950 RepID=A0ABU4DLV1_9DEIO|nr:asparaginase [Deinococcus sp. ZS9-10]MDV6373421.1 asparaginase [Deinococcus sp. ZS9-10]